MHNIICTRTSIYLLGIIAVLLINGGCATSNFEFESNRASQYSFSRASNLLVTSRRQDQFDVVDALVNLLNERGIKNRYIPANDMLNVKEVIGSAKEQGFTQVLVLEDARNDLKYIPRYRMSLYDTNSGAAIYKGLLTVAKTTEFESTWTRKVATRFVDDMLSSGI